MGEEESTTEVGMVVANGNLPPTKLDDDVSEMKDGEKEELQEMCEDTKDNEKDKDKEVNVDTEDADDNKKEAKSDAMEVDDEENENKIADVSDLKEKEDKAEEIKKTGSKKHATKKSGGEKSNNKKVTKEKKRIEKNEEPKTPVGPTIERPVRERKSVERLVAVIDNDTTKEFHIEKGRGTALKDIPNVAYKLSKRKVADDTLKLLHTILFARRVKALQIKSNILRFSGFVWHESEEKQKAKVQEKLDKYNKEKLFELCDLLDIPITRTTAEKEDVIAKLIDFLSNPHATTSELLAEKEQSSKGNKPKKPSKKSASTSGVTPSKDSSKKQKSKSVSEEHKCTSEIEDSEQEQEHQKSESVKHVSEPESGENKKKRKRDSEKPPKTKSKKETTLKESSPSQKKETTTESSKICSKSKDQSESMTKTFSRKKKNHFVDEKPSTPKKSASKEKTEGKKAVKEKERPKEEKQKPSDDELKAAVCQILKEVNFNTATFTDILKQLNKRFNTELTPRKTALKFMIQEELIKIADEADDENENETEKTGKEGSAEKA